MKIDLKEIPLSKSVQIRKLLLKSYRPEIEISELSLADDVNFMKQAVEGLHSGKDSFYLGSSATAFRFFCVRLSRNMGSFRVAVSSGLKARPHEELKELLLQLGVQNISWDGETLCFDSHGWPDRELRISVSTDYSSQYLSALFLNAWGFPFSIEAKISNTFVSQGYWNLTYNFLKKSGLRFEEGTFRVEKIPSTPSAVELEERDMSCLAALISFYCLKGSVLFSDEVLKYLQPDLEFFKWIQMLGVEHSHENGTLKFRAPSEFRGIRADLNSTPDLFPVLAVLASFSREKSEFRGIRHLQFKESNRIAKIGELLRCFGVSFVAEQGVVFIQGMPAFAKDVVVYDCLDDHRLVMAASLFQWMGAKINLRNSESVTKSFPNFFQIAPVIPRLD